MACSSSPWVQRSPIRCQNPSKDSKARVFGKEYSVFKFFAYGDDRHSKNGLNSKFRLSKFIAEVKFMQCFYLLQFPEMSQSGALAKIAPQSLLPSRQTVKVKGIDFDEEFISDLISNYFISKDQSNQPRLSDALQIYITESTAGDGRKFRGDALNSFRKFVNLIGDLHLSDLRHIHICQFRDYLFETGLTPVSVRKQTAIMSAMLNIAFRHLDIDRLSPFRGLKIQGETEHKRPMRTITHELLLQVKQRLLFRVKPYKLIGLIQLNTGMRLSEPVFARLDDLVLDHPIPHLWVRKNDLSNRKTKSSIRAVPLIGSSLYAAQRLHEIALGEGSEWLVPQYAHYHGSNSCSAILNKYLKDLDFRSHMFRHALVDRMKACNDIPTRLAESITGHFSGGSEFNNYGTIGYTLEQKLEVLRRIEI